MFNNLNLTKTIFWILLSIMIIDGTDNADYFLYKFNLSKKDQKRLKTINVFYKNKISSKSFSEENLNKIFYYEGKQSLIDILCFRVFTSRKIDNKLLKFIDQYQSKNLPSMPISAKVLMEKYQISEGKILGDKLKDIEEEWINNNFNLSEKQIDKIINR